MNIHFSLPAYMVLKLIVNVQLLWFVVVTGIVCMYLCWCLYTCRINWINRAVSIIIYRRTHTRTHARMYVCTHKSISIYNNNIESSDILYVVSTYSESSDILYVSTYIESSDILYVSTYVLLFYS